MSNTLILSIVLSGLLRKSMEAACYFAYGLFYQAFPCDFCKKFISPVQNNPSHIIEPLYLHYLAGSPNFEYLECLLVLMIFWINTVSQAFS